MNNSNLFKVTLGLVTSIFLIGLCFISLSVHFFTKKEYIADNETIPWKVASNEMKDRLSNCKNDFEKVCRIREFAYSHIDWSSQSNWQYGDSSVYEIYNYYENDLGGGYCGLAARYLTKLYDYYGFRSCTYDMGEPENKATHVTVVVQIEYNGRVVNTIQDPTFNFTITDTNLQPIDLSNLMQQIMNKEENFKILESDEVLYVEYLTNFNFTPIMSWNYISEYTKISPSNGRKFKYSLKTKRTLQRYVQCLGGRYFKAFDKHDLDPNMTSLFVMPINECECTSEELDTIVNNIIDKLVVKKN